MTLSMLVMMGLLAAQGPVAELPGRGISQELAQERAAAIRDLRYDLSFTLPADRRQPVQGRVVIRLELQAPHRIVLDFAQPPDRVRGIKAGGRDVAAALVEGHIVIPASATVSGLNEIAIEFVAGDEALNRNDEFLYTLFVPARAQLTFPCFDQPDLKARYTLSLTVPDGWQAVANSAEVRRRGVTNDGRAGAGRPSAPIEVAFAETKPLPTYLFSFAAGRFSIETANRGGRVLRIFHRETDAAKVTRNRAAIFDLHASALAWLEDYTGIPYPWGKFDVVLIPSFQFGGMEHAGAILYNQAGLMLDESATQNQLLNRASVIAHETAHMWFGDLVTMRWFNDVWMKEVFANFMAAKLVNPAFPQVNHELRFLLDHYPYAYEVDRTAGTNAIRQTLPNLNDAGQMYGPIIYEKAPIVMRQLEMIVGEQRFRDGLREYLKRYAFGNATWLDLVAILDAHTPPDITAWSRAWVEERGRPAFAAAVHQDANGLLDSIALAQTDPYRRGLVWPQRLQVALGYEGRVELLPVTVDAEGTTIHAGGRAMPQYVLPNGAGLGYGLFLLDRASREYLLGNIEDIPDALTRGSAWVTLWDNFLEAEIAPAAFLDAAIRALPHETDQQNAERVLAYVVRTFWRFLDAGERSSRSTALETMLRAGIGRGKTQSEKAAWFNAYRDTVATGGGLAWLERVWRREEKIPGLTFAEPDEITMALELAVRDVAGSQDILRTQLERIQNPDRKARFAFVMPALSSDAPERERAFARFRDVANRRREPWVLESLAYLNHPLREAHARRFVRPALDLLQEIQRTGDIFFPTRWMDATLRGHSSPEVAGIVRDFLAERTQYPQRLRWTILSTADELFRASVAGIR